MIKLTWMLLFVSFLGVGNECSDYDNLSPLQKGRLEFSYHQGVSDDLGYTLSAIALVESSSGKFRINPFSSDYGLYQVNFKTAVKVLGITSYYKKVQLAEKMIYNDPLNAYVAMEVLKYFSKYHKGDWKKMIMSYNNGFKINKEKAKDYLDRVSKSVKLLQQCMIII